MSKWLGQHVNTPEGPGTVVQDFSGVSEAEPNGAIDGFVRVNLDIPKMVLNKRTSKTRENMVTCRLNEVKLVDEKRSTD